MPSSMTKIQTITVMGSSTSTIDFTNIPSTYTDLCIKFSIRGGSNNYYVRFNGNTAASYSLKAIRGDGATVDSYFSGSSQTEIYFQGATSTSMTANTFSNSELYIPNYTSSNYKSCSFDTVGENNATTAYSQLVAGLWSNTAAITQVTVACGAGLAQYSTATLYGVTKYAETGTGSKAIGGTVTTASGYTYHTFFSSGMFTPTTSITGAEVLVVAGGGASGHAISGGGGAGGLVYASSQSFSSGVNYTAIVGAGGGNTAAYANVGCNGTNSAFASGTIAIGGGGGGGAGVSGANGGSGGGGDSTGAGLAGTATAGQGNAGARGASSYGGGGGGAGGAGVLGGTNTRGGDGGVGVSTYSAWGSATGTGQRIGSTFWYAGGGGGSPWNGVSANTNGGIGGNGGGGFGGDSGAGRAAESSGLPNTGGGAGGGNSGGSQSGGSGIVIIRYTT